MSRGVFNSTLRFILFSKMFLNLFEFTFSLIREREFKPFRKSVNILQNSKKYNVFFLGVGFVRWLEQKIRRNT